MTAWLQKPPGSFSRLIARKYLCATAQTAVSLVHILIHSERWLPCAALRVIVIPYFQESIMNKDQVKGRIEEAKGKVKEVAGKIVGNKDLEQKGKIQNTEGKVQAEYGDLREDLKKAI
jgi:uncharacterized protein YjbJ (UPF0337 family)